jgi:hypothetical protein
MIILVFIGGTVLVLCGIFFPQVDLGFPKPFVSCHWINVLP